jgi:DNA polymerase III epsilon subunit-like protein
VTRRPPRGAAYTELITGRTFVVIDIETTKTPETRTALSAYYPISIGAVAMRHGQVIDRFHTLIDPGHPVDAKSAKYNGIETKNLRGAPTPLAALTAFDAFLRKHPKAFFVCHNAGFDIGHLHASYLREGRKPFSALVLDTEFLGARFKVEDIPPFVKLDRLREIYGVSTTVAGPKSQAALSKGLKDAQDTAEILSHLLAEVARTGVQDFDEFLTKAKPRSVEEIASAVSRRRRKMRAPTITATHIKSHHGRPLAAKPTPAAVATWAERIATCVTMRCTHIEERVTVEQRHAKLLTPALTKLLPTSTGPGQMGTLLAALRPLIQTMNRKDARAWWKKNHDAVRAGQACEPLLGCPDCVAGNPCPRDVIIGLITRRAMDYGLAPDGKPLSLFSKTVSLDLYYGKSSRKIDTWPNDGMADLAAGMMLTVITEAQRKRMPTKERDLIRKVTDRDLQLHDPRLALEVAKYWARLENRDTDIDALVAAMTAKATSDPGFLELEVWHSGPYRRAVEARTAAKTRKARPKPKGVRKASELERRQPTSRPNYRFQIHRLPEAG